MPLYPVDAYGGYLSLVLTCKRGFIKPCTTTPQRLCILQTAWSPPVPSLLQTGIASETYTRTKDGLGEDSSASTNAKALNCWLILAFLLHAHTNTIAVAAAHPPTISIAVLKQVSLTYLTESVFQSISLHPHQPLRPLLLHLLLLRTLKGPLQSHSRHGYVDGLEGAIFQTN